MLTILLNGGKPVPRDLRVRMKSERIALDCRALFSEPEGRTEPPAVDQRSPLTQVVNLDQGDAAGALAGHDRSVSAGREVGDERSLRIHRGWKVGRFKF
jgi:hypothetical protein